MLPSIDPSGRLTGSLALTYIAALFPLSVAFFVCGLAGRHFLVGSIALGSAFFVLGLRLLRRRDRRVARTLFFGSIAYLPLLLGLLLLDPGPARTTPEPLALNQPASIPAPSNGAAPDADAR